MHLLGRAFANIVDRHDHAFGEQASFANHHVGDFFAGWLEHDGACFAARAIGTNDLGVEWNIHYLGLSPRLIGQRAPQIVTYRGGLSIRYVYAWIQTRFYHKATKAQK